ncbi:unnamed protein product [Rhizopus stolonifer]
MEIEMSICYETPERSFDIVSLGRYNLASLDLKIVLYEHLIDLPFTRFKKLKVRVEHDLKVDCILLLIRTSLGVSVAYTVYSENERTVVEKKVSLTKVPNMLIHLTSNSIKYLSLEDYTVSFYDYVLNL